MSGRGKKINPTKNHRAHEEWMHGKKIGRRKQQWVWDSTRCLTHGEPCGCTLLQEGHWEKV